jgi:hypothetical protein
MPEWASTVISVAVNQKLAHGKLGNFLALLSARTNFQRSRTGDSFLAQGDKAKPMYSWLKT